jgi:hypothetical protein
MSIQDFPDFDPDEDDGLLDSTDTLDGEPIEDPLDTGFAAADKWAGANRFGTTAREARHGESLDDRLAEEEPELDPYGEGGPDEDEITRRGYETDPRSGRLVDEDEGSGEHTEIDSIADDVGIDAAGASAEEAAIHTVDEPDAEGEDPEL